MCGPFSEHEGHFSEHDSGLGQISLARRSGMIREFVPVFGAVYLEHFFIIPYVIYLYFCHGGSQTGTNIIACA